jgi:WD40 repeat protein
MTFQTPMSQSLPHIYLSALPFSPKHSRMSSLFLHEYPNTLTVAIGATPDWPALLNVFEGHSDFVSSVAFSPGGKRIVTGSWDCSVKSECFSCFETRKRIVTYPFYDSLGCGDNRHQSGVSRP